MATHSPARRRGTMSRPFTQSAMALLMSRSCRLRLRSAAHTAAVAPGGSFPLGWRRESWSRALTKSRWRMDMTVATHLRVPWEMVSQAKEMHQVMTHQTIATAVQCRNGSAGQTFYWYWDFSFIGSFFLPVSLILLCDRQTDSRIPAR